MHLSQEGNSDYWNYFFLLLESTAETGISSNSSITVDQVFILHVPAWTTS